MLTTFPCWRCGKEIERVYEPQYRVFCPECKELDEKDREALKAENAIMRRRMMFDTAIRKLENGRVYMHEYRDIAHDMKQRIMDGEEDFRSADEIIAAMVLESYNVPYEANKRIYGCVVDFYIPSMHIILEIDGDRHKWSEAKDGKRDFNLRACLGREWEVIHIPTTYLEKKPEALVDAIEALYKERRKLRHLNHGLLPEYSSRREMMYYEKLVPMRKEKLWKK